MLQASSSWQFPLKGAEVACPLLPLEEIYLRFRKNATLFEAFPGAFSIYLGKRGAKCDAERRLQTGKDAFLMLRQIM
jgi:hypothetical protein